MAGMGPSPMTEGSTPAWAQDTTLASGLLHPSWVAAVFEAKRTAAAPSLIPEAFPAVTVPEPSFMKAGFSLDSFSTVVPWRGNSSASTVMGPTEVSMVV